MYMSFMQSGRLNKKLEELNGCVCYDYLVNKVQGYRDDDTDPYVLLQMGADLAKELCDSDGYSNGNKIWHLRSAPDNWFIPAKDEKEVEEILDKLLPESTQTKGRKMKRTEHKIGVMNEHDELLYTTDTTVVRIGQTYDGPCLWPDLDTAKEVADGLGEGLRFVKVMLTIEDLD